jgi:hypothetical protein
MLAIRSALSGAGPRSSALAAQFSGGAVLAQSPASLAEEGPWALLTYLQATVLWPLA